MNKQVFLEERNKKTTQKATIIFNFCTLNEKIEEDCDLHREGQRHSEWGAAGKTINDSRKTIGYI